MRLLFHGKLIMKINELNLLLSASRDPNNTTEKMVIVWETVLLNWTNGIVFRMYLETFCHLLLDISEKCNEIEQSKR